MLSPSIPISPLSFDSYFTSKSIFAIASAVKDNFFIGLVNWPATKKAIIPPTSIPTAPTIIKNWFDIPTFLLILSSGT